MQRRHFMSGLVGASIAMSPLSGEAFESDGPAFDFRSNFWVNLHHRLYKTADWSDAKIRGYRISGSGLALLATPALLPADRRDAWNAAVETYRRAFIVPNRDLLFDDGLVAINGVLTETPIAALPAGLPDEVEGALKSTAPLYDEFWHADDRINRDWIAALEPGLRTYGHPIERRLAAVYESPWPRKPFRVDVSRYGHRFGAYTVTRPRYVHTVAESGDPRLAGLSGVEMMYHEASHAVVVQDEGTIGGEILAAARRAGHREPDQFWHAVIFFSAGSIARRAFRTRGIPYRMYADANGLFSPRVWPHYRGPLQTHWQAYMDHGGDLRATLDRCVAELPT